jgi:hypothetical protein
MAGDIEQFISAIIDLYREFLLYLPGWAQEFINLFLISVTIVIYAILVWKFYRWIAKKDILELNLKRYNQLQHRVLAKTLAVLIYFLEYIIILPIIVFIWFSIFTLFLIMLTENINIQIILLSSVTIIAAIRITAYYKEELSRDIAKLFPLTLLAVAVTQGLVSFDKLITQLSLIPSFFSNFWTYLFFIMIVEFFLRVLDLFFSAIGIENEREIKAKE